MVHGGYELTSVSEPAAVGRMLPAPQVGRLKRLARLARANRAKGRRLAVVKATVREVVAPLGFFVSAYSKEFKVL